MKNIFYNIAVFLVIVSFCLMPAIGLISSTVAVEGNYGLDDTSKQFGDKIPTENVSVASFVGRIINVVLSFLGIIFLILIIYGGFMWMTAGGKEEKVQKAIQIFTNASFGLLIVIAAYLITRFIGNAIISSLR